MPPTPDKFWRFVNGVRTRTGDHTAWIRLAERYIDAQPNRDRADSYDYYTPAVFRWRNQAKHCTILGDLLLEDCKNHAIVNAVGHSNGCPLLCDALRKCENIRLGSLHLIASAALSDFEENGLNLAVKRGQVESIHLYCSKGDDVLRKYAKPSRRLFGWLGLGYGSMGLDGPANMSDAARLITRQHWNNDYGHSTWVHERLPDTLRLITGDA